MGANEDAVLIVAPSWIGDMVMAHVLIAELAAQNPGRPIDVLAPSALQPLIARMPEVRASMSSPFGHGDFAAPQRWQLGRTLRGRYTSAFVLPGTWKSALVPFAARIPRRCGYLREQRWGLLNDIRPMPRALTRKTALLYQALADPAVLDDPGRLRRPRLSVAAPRVQHLRWSLDIGPRPFVALVPGAGFGTAKRWPVRHWSALARDIDASGCRPVVLGGAADRAMADAIREACPATSDLTGRTGLDDVVDLMSGAKLVVSNDTGLMHVAAAAGGPVIALYGSTSPADTPPLSARAATVSLGLACAPCHARVCPLGHHACLETLMPRRVLDAMDMLLATPRQATREAST